jgi:hypothetical protein
MPEMKNEPNAEPTAEPDVIAPDFSSDNEVTGDDIAQGLERIAALERGWADVLARLALLEAAAEGPTH